MVDVWWMMDRSSDEARKWFRRCAWRDYAYWQLGFQLERVNQVYFSNDTDGPWWFAGVWGGGSFNFCGRLDVLFFFFARMLHYWPSLPEEAMRMVSWQILVGTKAFIEKNPIQNKKPRNLAEIHPWSPVLVAKNLGLSKLPATLLHATACNLTISRTKVDLHHDGILWFFHIFDYFCTATHGLKLIVEWSAEAFREMQWLRSSEDNAVEAWRNGLTGFPLVDAVAWQQVTLMSYVWSWGCGKACAMSLSRLFFFCSFRCFQRSS